MKINFGGTIEDILTCKEYSIEKARKTLDDELVSIIDYGYPGGAYALNLKDNGINVIVGQKEKTREWDKVKNDGWVPGLTLFSLEEAAEKGTIVQYPSVSSEQISLWPSVQPFLTEGKALLFTQGLPIAYRDQLGVIPPKDVDVVLVAPQSYGKDVRSNYLGGIVISLNYAVYQNHSGKAIDRTKALAIGIGSEIIFPTTFEKEAWSDLTADMSSPHVKPPFFGPGLMRV